MHSRRTICRPVQALAACTALVLASVPAAQAAGGRGGPGAPGVAPAQESSAPAVEQRAIPPSAPAPSQDGSTDGPVVAELDPTGTEDFGLVGVTWAAGSGLTDLHVEIRTRHDGVWSDWSELEVDIGDGDGTDGQRDGTEPAWVGEADGVAARLSGSQGAPDDVRLATVNIPDAPASGNAAPALAPITNPAADQIADDGSPKYTPQPTIISRKTWGAGKPDYCSSPQVGSTTRGVVVHHTAGSNTYSASQSAGIVRGIQAYHQNGRGWCDIGYNFLVDKYGQIFEGRSGGIRKNIRAAHSGNDAVNTFTTGISMMGNLDQVKPTAAMKSAMVKLVGWRMGTTFLPAKGSYSLGGRNLQMIAGHRDVVSTGCPGSNGYHWLSSSGGLRDRVEDYISNYSTNIKTRADQLGKSVTGDVYVGEFEVPGGRRARFAKVDIYDTSGQRARDVGGSIRSAYGSAGNNSGPLGFPRSFALKRDGVTVQKFDHGRIYQVSSSTSYALWGNANDAYLELGGAQGRLGRPTSTLRAESDSVDRVTFEHGYIRAFDSGTTRAYDSSGSIITTSSGGSDDRVNLDGNTFTLKGRGYGHGAGMSQHGAHAAAKAGLSLKKIMHFYYPGTKGADVDGFIRVLLTADTNHKVLIKGRSFVWARDLTSNRKVKLPTKIDGEKVERWRLNAKKSDQSKTLLRYQTTGKWRTFDQWAGDGQFERGVPEKPMALILPSGATAKYRGYLRLVDGDTVNVLTYDSYVRGVIAREMPSSWHPTALKAQAVAARSYGASNLTPSRHYDLCDTTSCQVYGGMAAETSNTDAAVAGTAGRIRTYEGKPAFTQFSASSGGLTSQGSKPYLPAKIDPYDDYPPWTKTVNASAVEGRYGLGNLERVDITERTGQGTWGGRVVSIKFTGSSGTKTISGNEARSVLGLKSNFFAFD